MKKPLLASALFFVSSVAIAQPPPLAVRWTASNLASAQPQGSALGDPLVVTWGFMAPGTPINDNNGIGPNANNNLQTFLNGIYGNQATWQPLFAQYLNRWGSISGISYVFEANDDGATITDTSSPGGILGVRADLRIGGKLLDGNSNVLAYNYFPNQVNGGGDMVIDTGDNFYNNTANNSLGLRNVLAHEHGHGMGHQHVQSNNAAFLMEPFINLGFDGPQYHDILMMQRGYGDFNEKSFAGLGNDVFSRATALGSIANNGSVSIGNSARTLVVAANATDFFSIDAQTDTDFYSFSVANAGQISVLLEALGITYNVTNQGGAGNVAFASSQRSNLALALLDSDGTTVLATANINGLGGNESIVFNLAAAGTYYIRITGTDNPDAITTDTQFYGLSASFIGAAIPEPMTIGLVGLGGIGVGGIFLHRRRNQKKLAESRIG